MRVIGGRGSTVFNLLNRPIRAPEQIPAGCQRKSVLQLAIQASCCYHVLAQKSF